MEWSQVQVQSFKENLKSWRLHQHLQGIRKNNDWELEKMFERTVVGLGRDAVTLTFVTFDEVDDVWRVRDYVTESNFVEDFLRVTCEVGGVVANENTVNSANKQKTSEVKMQWSSE